MSSDVRLSPEMFMMVDEKIDHIKLSNIGHQYYSVKLSTKTSYKTIILILNLILNQMTLQEKSKLAVCTMSVNIAIFFFSARRN